MEKEISIYFPKLSLLKDRKGKLVINVGPNIRPSEYLISKNCLWHRGGEVVVYLIRFLIWLFVVMLSTNLSICDFLANQKEKPNYGSLFNQYCFYLAQHLTLKTS